MREHDGALGDGVDRHGEAQLGEVVEEGPLEQRLTVVAGQSGQVLDVVSLKTKCFEEVDDGREPAAIA